MRQSLLILIFHFSLTTFGQNNLKTTTFDFSGYVKNIESIRFDRTFTESTVSNLLYNRLNSKLSFHQRFICVIELRNYLAWGDEKGIATDTAQVTTGDEWVGLNKNWFSDNRIACTSNIDRLYLEYRKGNYSFRAGRQRINWGVTTNWNPNDLFNTYNFLDFNYEERPGTDGFLAHYRQRNSSMDLAAAGNGTWNESILAMRYSANKWNYDFNFNAGHYHQFYTGGTSWAGSIGDAGFKGEFQYFIHEHSHACQITVESDYSFEKGWYINAGMLFNSNGLNRRIKSPEELILNINALSLMPSKWNIDVISSKQLNPLWTAHLTTVYSPNTDLFILFPSVNYNASENIDITFFWQSFFVTIKSNLQSQSNSAYIRISLNF